MLLPLMQNSSVEGLIMRAERMGRRRRKRGALARMSMPPVNPAHAKWVASSVGQVRQAEEEYRRLKADRAEGERLFEEAKMINMLWSQAVDAKAAHVSLCR